MKKLYNPNGHIRVELIEKALEEAKKRGDLPNFPSSKIKYFTEGIKEEMEKFRSRVGTQINKGEMEFLFKQMMLDDYDKITDRELEIIEKIILDDDLEVR